MTGNQTRADVRDAIRRVLAAHYRCDEHALTDEGVTVVEADATPGQFRFPVPRKPLAIVTMGGGVLVSAHAARVPHLRATLGPMQRDDIFSARVISSLAREIEPDGQGLRGPLLKYACCRDDLLPAIAPAGVAIELCEGARVAERYAELGATSTLYYPRGGGRGAAPDVMAAVATRGGGAIGIAGASADTDALWQIAVEVLVEARGYGVGRAVVGQLTRGILAAGKIPYYTTTVSHIGSRTLAIGLGYRPVWTEMYARDLPGASV